MKKLLLLLLLPFALYGAKDELDELTILNGLTLGTNGADTTVTFPDGATLMWDTSEQAWVAVGDVQVSGDLTVSGIVAGVSQLEFQTVASMLNFDYSTTTDGRRVKCNGYHVANDGFFGPDVFWDATSTATADNFSVFDPVASGAGRLVREFQETVNILWAGCHPNYNLNATVSSNSEELQAIFDYFRDKGTYGTVADVYVPAGRFRVRTPVTCQAPVYLHGTINRGNGFGAGENAPNCAFSTPDDIAAMFYFDNTYGVRIEGLKFDYYGSGGSPGIGIAIGENPYTSTAADPENPTQGEGNMLSGPRIEFCSITGFDTLLSINNSVSYQVLSCSFTSPLSTGLLIQNEKSPDSGDGLVSGSTFNTSLYSGTAIWHKSSGGLKVTDNKILEHTYGYFAQLAQQGSNTAGTYSTSIGLLTGNSFESQSHSAIFMTDASAGTRSWTKWLISNNQFSLTSDIMAQDGAITASDATLTSASGPFTGAMVGNPIVVNGAGAGGIPLSTTIASYTSATEVELTDAASTTVTSVTVFDTYQARAARAVVITDSPHTGTARVDDSPTTSQIQLATNAGNEDDNYVGQLIMLTGGTGSHQRQSITDYDAATNMVTVGSPWSPVPSTDTTYEISDNDTFRNIVITGNVIQGPGNPGGAIDIYRANNVTIDSNSFWGSTTGITVRHASSNVLIGDGNVFQDCTVNVNRDGDGPQTGAAYSGGASTLGLERTVGRHSWRDNHYNGQTITMTSGAANGDKRVISDYDGITQTVTVATPWSSTPSAADTYSINVLQDNMIDYQQYHRTYELLDTNYAIGATIDLFELHGFSSYDAARVKITSFGLQGSVGIGVVTSEYHVIKNASTFTLTQISTNSTGSTATVSHSVVESNGTVTFRFTTNSASTGSTLYTHVEIVSRDDIKMNES